MLPKSVKSKCPAIMLAANRTARVPGRMTLLIVSIRTINGIRTEGVPWGTRWANICWVWLIQPLIIRVNHRGSDRARVIAMCLDLVNTYGKRPKKLLYIIKENNETKNIVDPTQWIFNSALNSLWRVKIISLQHKDQREGEAQKR